MATEFWFKFYFKDWGDDVKPLSLTARGLLIELIITLRKCNGIIKIDIPLLCRLTGGTETEIKSSLQEFRGNNTFDFEGEFLKSRKIIKEFRISQINKQNGEMGGNPALLKKKKKITKPKSPSLQPADKKIFVPPTLHEVQIFFIENGFTAELGEKVFKYYAEAEPKWHDSRGNKVRNWKQKMRGVWFDEKNKNNATGHPKKGQLSRDAIENGIKKILDSNDSK